MTRDLRKQTVFFDRKDHEALESEARRLNRAKAWLIQRAWKIARAEIRRAGDVDDAVWREHREREAVVAGGRAEDGITDDDLEKLRHMLGVGPRHPRRAWGFRNHYAPGASDVPAMERLVAAGLAERGAPYREAHFYHATASGCQRAGLSKAATRRVMDGT